MLESTDLFAASDLLQKMSENFSASKSSYPQYEALKSLHKRAVAIHTVASSATAHGELMEHAKSHNNLQRQALLHMKKIGKTHPHKAHASQMMKQMADHNADLVHRAHKAKFPKEFSANENFAAEKMEALSGKHLHGLGKVKVSHGTYRMTPRKVGYGEPLHEVSYTSNAGKSEHLGVHPTPGKAISAARGHHNNTVIGYHKM